MPKRRVLVAGVGPIPPDRPEKIYAPGLRLWGLADELEKHGHEVILAEAMFAGKSYGAAPSTGELAGRNIQLHVVSLDPAAAAEEFRSIAAAKPLDAAISSTDVMNCALALAQLPCPIWTDLLGHPMAERQMLARIHGSDDGLASQWLMVLPALLASDRFSACSERQKAALLGELGAVGRLNQHTAGLQLVDVIPQVLIPPDTPAPQGLVRGRLVKEGEFAVLHSGGYNTWMDEETLFKGLELAMSRDVRVHFVSVGGAISGHNEKTYEVFQGRVARSRFKDRYHFEGWKTPGEVAGYYAECDAAVNVDHFSTEGLLGTRTRILEWAAAGLPIVASALSDLTEDLADRDLILTFGFGDAMGLSEKILSVARNREDSRARAERAKTFVEAEYGAAKVAECVLKWLENPLPSPDLPPSAMRPGAPGPLHPENALGRFWAKQLREGSLKPGSEAGLKSRLKSAAARVRTKLLKP